MRRKNNKHRVVAESCQKAAEHAESLAKELEATQQLSASASNLEKELESAKVDLDKLVSQCSVVVERADA